MAGRPKNSAALQMAMGDPRKLGRRKLAQMAEAEARLATLGLPALPAGVVLGPIGMECWTAWTQELHARNRLALVDGHSLAAAAAAYEAAMLAQQDLREHGVMVTVFEDPETGEVRRGPNPAAKIMADMLRVAKQFMTEHGLTEASRSRLQKTDHKPEATMADIIESRKVDFSGIDMEKLQ